MYPFQLAISPTAIKIYLTTTLFLATSFVLLSTSTTAFGLFYYNFIPQTDLERPIYLQYAADAYPSAVVPLKTNALISQQPYDVSIVLHMPRDPVNLGLGNFMLDLSLHGNTENLESTVLKTLKLEDQVPSPTLKNSAASFYDLSAHLVYDLGTKNSLAATGYLSHDRFRLASDTVYEYRNVAASLKWKHDFNDKF